MSQPINLNKVRKAKARVEKQTRADANAVKFGQTKAQKTQTAQATAKAERRLEGHKLGDPTT